MVQTFYGAFLIKAPKTLSLFLKPFPVFSRLPFAILPIAWLGKSATLLIIIHSNRKLQRNLQFLERVLRVRARTHKHTLFLIILRSLAFHSSKSIKSSSLTAKMA